MAIPVALITELLIPVGKKLFSKTKTGNKEITGLAVIVPSIITIYDQFSIGGFEAVQYAPVVSLAGGLFLLVQRLYTKHKEDKAPNVLS